MADLCSLSICSSVTVLWGSVLYICSQSDQTFYTSCKLTFFCWMCPSKHHMKSPLHCNHRSRLVKYTIHLAFSIRDSILTAVNVVLQVEVFGNSGGMNYKFDHITSCHGH
jgi:hypothetical protein